MDVDEQPGKNNSVHLSDSIKLIHYWSQEATNLLAEVQSAKADHNNYQKHIFNPTLLSKIKKTCSHPEKTKADACVDAVLSQMQDQLSMASERLQDANKRVHWSSVASYACPVKTEGWNPIASELVKWDQANPTPKGVSIYIAAREVGATDVKAGALGSKDAPALAHSGRGGTQGRPSLRKANQEKAQVEHACLVKFRDAKGKSLDGPMNLNADEVCHNIANTDLVGFAPELTYLMGDVQGHHYFEVLRMEALTQYMRASYELTGKYPEIPAECAPFKKGLENIRNGRVPQEFVDRYKMRKDPKYLIALHQAATMVETASNAAEEFDRVVPCTTKNGYRENRGCMPNPEYPEAQKHKKEMQEEIIRLISIFPILKAGHDGSKEIHRDLPIIEKFTFADPNAPDFAAIMNEVINEGGPLLNTEIVAGLKEYCNDDPSTGGHDWQELISMKALTDTVLHKPGFAQFNMIQDCAMEALGQKEIGRTLGMITAGLGCIPLAVVTAGYGGYVCAAAFLGDQFLDVLKADEKMLFVNRCLNAGETVCNIDDYQNARDGFESSVEAFVAGAALTVVGEGAGLVKQLREVERFGLKGSLTALELKNLSRQLRAAKSPKQIEELFDRITEIQMSQYAKQAKVAVSTTEIAKIEELAADAAVSNLKVHPDRIAKIKVDYADLISNVKKDIPFSSVEDENKLITIISKLEDEKLDRKQIEAQIKKFKDEYKSLCKG
jgi:hypothetical protein